MKGKHKIFVALILVTGASWIFCYAAGAQNHRYAKPGWQLLDYRQDGIFGAGVTKAYRELLKGKKAHTVIVAVIDGGVDTAHEDLIGHIWTNKKEIPGNGIDDDGNGYVDDIHGWNFLGGRDGRNITQESYESYREYYRLRRTADSMPAGSAEKRYWLKVKDGFQQDSLRQAKAVSMVGQMIPQMQVTDSILRKALQKDSVFARDVEVMETTDSATGAARKNGLQYFRKYWISPEMALGQFIVEAARYLAGAELELKSFSEDPNALRKEIVGDDFNNINDRDYGNNNIAAGTSTHGTHVSGIIAASRNNGIGMDGVADHALIMPIRAIPEGDERDKDVALAIRYAVDNGAAIINLSFGKYFSPEKKWVDDAVRYADSHDVLLIHTAGNEERNIDTIPNYPDLPDGVSNGAFAFLTVGASAGGPDSLLVAPFSNYGKKTVDLFAPGVKIYSTVPGNQYETYSGTSMAAPVVSGIAALLLEYYPALSARQLKYVIVHSVMRLPHRRVRLAGGKTVDFNSLSAGAGIVNAYNALKLAATLRGKRGRMVHVENGQARD